MRRVEERGVRGRKGRGGGDKALFFGILPLRSSSPAHAFFCVSFFGGYSD